MFKKGDITDVLSLIIIAFVIIIGFFTIAYIVPFITNGLSNAGLNNTVEGKNAIDKLYDFGVSGIQKGVTFLFIGLLISILISGFYADTHPIWLFLYIIFLVISVIISAYLANAYQTIISVSAFNSFEQTYLTVIMQHSVYIYIFVGCLSFILIFTKFAYSGGSNQI